MEHLVLIASLIEYHPTSIFRHRSRQGSRLQSTKNATHQILLALFCIHLLWRLASHTGSSSSSHLHAHQVVFGEEGENGDLYLEFQMTSQSRRANEGIEHRRYRRHRPPFHVFNELNWNPYKENGKKTRGKGYYYHRMNSACRYIHIYTYVT